MIAAISSQEQVCRQHGSRSAAVQACIWPIMSREVGFSYQCAVIRAEGLVAGVSARPGPRGACRGGVRWGFVGGLARVFGEGGG